MSKILFILFVLLAFLAGCGSETPDNPIIDIQTWLWDSDPCIENGTQFLATFLATENLDQDFKDNFIFGNETWYVSGGLNAFRAWWAEQHPDIPLGLEDGAMYVTYLDGSTEIWIMGKKIKSPDGRIRIWLDPRTLFEEVSHKFNMRFPNRIANPHEWYEKVRDYP